MAKITQAIKDQQAQLVKDRAQASCTRIHAAVSTAKASSTHTHTHAKAACASSGVDRLPITIVVCNESHSGKGSSSEEDEESCLRLETPCQRHDSCYHQTPCQRHEAQRAKALDQTCADWLQPMPLHAWLLSRVLA